MLNAQTRLRDFPSLRDQTYLDTAAEGIPPSCVKEVLEHFWQDKLLGVAGRAPAHVQRDQCRNISAKLLGLKPSEVSFCSCSAEAYNLLATALQLRQDDEVVISDLDFPSGATPWLAGGVGTRLWKAHDGVLELEDLARILNQRTRLVQVSLVSFYNGYRIPWAPFVNMVRAQAPGALVAVDITQALGRCVLDCQNADFIVSSTHKWALGISGGGIVGIPESRAEQLTTRAGGWFHLANAFEADRFERAIPKRGAASFSVGMPSFAPLYVLNATLRYLDLVGIEAIARHADPLVRKFHRGLSQLGIQPMAPLIEGAISGIVAFRHPNNAQIYQELLDRNIRIMNMVGRLRVSLHGYNTEEDVDRVLDGVKAVLHKSKSS